MAEEGDNSSSLAKFLNVTPEEASELLLDQGYTADENGIVNLKVGDKVTLDNVFTQSIKEAKNPYTFTMRYEYQSAIKTAEKTMKEEDWLLVQNKEEVLLEAKGKSVEDYNCWGSAIAGSQGNTIEEGVGENFRAPGNFDKVLKEEYVPTTEENAQFGKTVLRFVKNGETTHGAVYYGKNNAGEIYVYTKNGWKMRPVIIKLSELVETMIEYGNVQGFKDDSGYYDPKSR